MVLFSCHCVCVLAGLAGRDPADPHSLFVAADVRHDHAQSQPACAFQLAHGLSALGQHHTAEQLEVRNAPTAVYISGFVANLDSFNHQVCFV